LIQGSTPSPVLHGYRKRVLSAKRFKQTELALKKEHLRQ
jgi:hypothetical protein